MAGSRAVIVGDVIDDIIVVPAGEVRSDTDTTASITRTSGGSAANTASWLGWLRAEVDMVGRVGRGDREHHEAQLREVGVVPHLTEDAHHGTGTIVIVVEGERRTMLTDRGANATLDPAQVSDQLLAAAAVLHLTGYSLFDALDVAAVRSLIDRAHQHEVLVSFDPGSAGFIADYGVDRFRAAIAGIDVVLANSDEGAMLANATSGDRSSIATALLDLAPTAILTGGAASVLVAQRGVPLAEVPVTPATVVDPTGAGDAFTAGYLSALLAGASPTEAAARGVQTARVAVTYVGGRPVPHS